jgi:hypothetical protein
MYQNGYYRIASANISESGISITGEPDTIFDDLVSIYSVNFLTYNNTVLYNTFTLFNADSANSGKIFSEFNANYPARTFQELGPYYNSMTFSDMAVMPLGDTLNPYVN